MVDVARGQATLDGRPVLMWTGAVRGWTLTLDTLSTTFVGTDADERVTLASGHEIQSRTGLTRSISMAGGDDVLDIWSVASGTLDGGVGRDRISAGCSDAVIRLGGTFRCLGSYNPGIDYTGAFLGWEDVTVASYGTADITGTPGRDRIAAHGRSVRIDGRAGNDQLRVDYYSNSASPRGTSNVRGGAGSDLVTGNTGHDRLSGGRGRDRIYGLHGKDTLRGGAGRDVLLGGKMADRVFGGPGRDVARGEGGRDRCLAEVRRTCELP